jgi:hypothetical protein
MNVITNIKSNVHPCVPKKNRCAENT